MNTPTSSPSNSTAIKEVTAAIEQLRNAMISADGIQLDQLASHELTYGHSGGQMQNKQEFISSFTSGESIFVDIEISNQTVRVIGNTAIVRHILSAATNDKGRDRAALK